MKYLVTGGAGFIGSHLVDRLIDGGGEVVIIDNLSTGKKENINSEATFYNADICDAGINAIFREEKPEIIFHLAAQIDVRKSTKDPLEDAKTNILGSLNILENAKTHNTKKFIFTSTGGAIYGEAGTVPTPETYKESPVSPYGINKLAIEKYLHYYGVVSGLEYAVLRLANVYGPRQNSKGEAGVVAVFCQNLLTRQTPTIYGSGKQTRDFIYVKDVTGACINAIIADKNTTYNIGTAKETSVNEIFESLERLTGYTCFAIHKPARSGEQLRSCLNISKACQELGWQPKYFLNEGLAETVEWFKDNTFKS
jgi:UDP-glucose 4-epimerase